MGMLGALVGSRVPEKFRKYFKLPPREESFKIADTGATRLGVAAAAWLEGKGDRCGVFRLDLGLDALSMRIALIDAAEKSIDIQSYLIKDDLSGNLIALRLLDAAGRGVRVRLLMDDALTEEIDSGLDAIDEHENIEVRVFNPFPRRRSRVVSFIANFNILNRRMHNKSFTVDNQVTIVGGRNLADEYYQTSDDSEFLDEDLLAIGPVVDAVSDGFDEYWNTPEAMPMDAFDALVRHRSSVEETIEAGRRFLEENNDSPQLADIDSSLVDRLLAGSLPLIEADAEVVLDHPDKIRGLTRNQIGETNNYLQQLISSASNEVIIVSPYFVPQKRGVEFLGELVDRGVRVIVITNSLASTNHNSVHAVYARYRVPLLKRGVELHELRPRFSATRTADAYLSEAKLTLHSKVAVVDRQKLFVGSFNLDPRSLYINTEMGMSVASDELATDVSTSITRSLGRQTYSLRLAGRRGLRWKFLTRNGVRVSAREPHTTVGRRFKTWLISWLPIESQM